MYANRTLPLQYGVKELHEYAQPDMHHSVQDRWSRRKETLEGVIRPHQIRKHEHERTVRTGSVWSGREDLNLRPLRPERNALPGCATPRQKEQNHNARGIVLHQGVETQAMGIGHPSTGNLTARQVHPFRQSSVCPHGPFHPLRGQT